MAGEQVELILGAQEYEEQTPAFCCWTQTQRGVEGAALSDAQTQQPLSREQVSPRLLHGSPEATVQPASVTLMASVEPSGLPPSSSAPEGRSERRASTPESPPSRWASEGVESLPPSLDVTVGPASGVFDASGTFAVFDEQTERIRVAAMPSQAREKRPRTIAPS